MSDKLFICKRGWKRHSTGTIINEWDWLKLAIETRENHFEPYDPPTSTTTDTIYHVPQEPEPEPEVTPFQENLTNQLKEKGIQAKFKHKFTDGKPELDATFTFETEA